MTEPYLLLVNGPNLNRLGVRKPETYGSRTLADVVQMVRDTAASYGYGVVDKQSNHEGELIDFLQSYGPNAHGIIINPGAFGHYSYALRDCLEDIDRPTIEVHISNVHRREAFRHHLVLSDVVRGQVVGLGTEGYRYATLALCQPRP
ncbi:3-dehydroquinate dehydratase [Alicyclobacillus hesperidum subsp. aegles]|uniref:3-dehydroquinate dehydratase n=1 Tax=Alicyclobacillus hesperidum TaxID=89784 RepID=A0A1H2T7C0_9BACL|nr:type II 3-dehydroquinate dehydratase [Alicyclobacillus hesperidum]KRW91984.1 3-dehydroquinate dehydratase [Alicyclobacillus tengchongensis]GLG00952.1 3-dehydroquinate dehydratase [Alicyclobacillus hesperidum subsp. aegles]GLV13770.1 3-dehydroquinate dehydratase [Alicyclobacillus hesperidum]SDW39169.1 3-dehydroquinate dehydratase [Alicyclobacillus hesperidum]